MTAAASFEDDEPVPVDLPHRRSFDAEVVGDRIHERVPVIPDYLRDRATFELWVRFRTRQVVWALWFHVARVHVYTARLTLWSPAGVYRSVRWVIGWVFESFERIAHRYGSGVDDATIEACLNVRELLGELERRAAQLKTLRATARDLVPDSKVTATLAERRSLGL